MLVVGINHKSAELCFRELLAFSKEVLEHALLDLFIFVKKNEVALISTCNRTEIYTTDTQVASLFAWLEQYCGVSQLRLQQSVYIYKENQAIRHLMRVACGLDSHIVGESQILGQLKYSYGLAREAGTIGKKLSRLFETTFSVAKVIRANTQINHYPVSIASLILKKTIDLVPNLLNTRILFLGAGKMSELCASYFYKKGVHSMSFANRTLIRAQRLADKYDGIACTLSQAMNLLSSIDIVIVATGSSLPILTLKHVQAACMKRSVKSTLYLFDLAMPRNIDTQVTQVPYVQLYNIDDLQSIADKNMVARKTALESAVNIIEHHVQSLQAWLHGQTYVKVIKQYRLQAKACCEEEVKKALLALKKGHCAEDIIRLLGYQLTNKLLHQPTMALHQAAQESDKKISVACEVLGIEQIKEV